MSHPKLNNFHRYIPDERLDDDIDFALTGIVRNTVGTGQDLPENQPPPLYALNWNEGQTLPDYQCLIISEGAGIFETKESGALQIQPGSVLFITPGTWHRYRPTHGSNWVERWISFTGSTARFLYHKKLTHLTNQPLQINNIEQFIQSFDTLAHKINNPDFDGILLGIYAQSYLVELLKTTSNQFKKSSENHELSEKKLAQKVIANSIMDDVWSRNHHTFCLNKITRRFSCSKRSIERIFKEHFGHSIMDEIMKCRVTRASRLLRETKLPIKMVSYLAGYSSPERLRVSLTEFTELSPSAYRNRYLQDNFGNSQRVASQLKKIV